MSLTPQQLAAIEINRGTWNQRTAVHLKSEFYDLASFRAGRCSLAKLDVETLGDVRGKSLVHLQCHFGQDTLSWARRGATVTGLDLSDEAVAAARSLANQLGLAARFERGNVYDAATLLRERYDIVYTSWGVLGWLPDLDAWARVVYNLLLPGGVLYLAEFHPFLWVFDDAFREVVYPWNSRGEAIETQESGTYADPGAPLQMREYGWNHGTAEVLSALLGVGLQIERYVEIDYSPYNCFPDMVEDGPGEFVARHWGRKVPYGYAVVGRAPAGENARV